MTAKVNGRVRAQSIQLRRLMGACGIVGLLAVALAASVIASNEQPPHDEQPADAEPIGIAAATLDWSDDPQKLLDGLEGFAHAQGQVPQAFTAEAALPLNCREVRADPTGAVIGCTVALGEEEAFRLAAQELAARGWRAIPLKGMAGATFLKGTGSLHWMLVTCTQVGNETSIVYRLE